jgi:hypothetical protein
VATYHKFNQFVEDAVSGVHQLKTGSTHTYKVMLTNTAPVATNSIKSDITEIAGGNGYTAGGTSIGTVTGGQVSGVFSFFGSADPSWTASGGSIATFQYAVVYNDTQTSPVKPLLGWADYGSPLTVTTGQTFLVDLNQITGILTIT